MPRAPAPPRIRGWIPALGGRNDGMGWVGEGGVTDWLYVGHPHPLDPSTWLRVSAPTSGTGRSRGVPWEEGRME